MGALSSLRLAARLASLRSTSPQESWDAGDSIVCDSEEGADELQFTKSQTDHGECLDSIFEFNLRVPI